MTLNLITVQRKSCRSTWSRRNAISKAHIDAPHLHTSFQLYLRVRACIVLSYNWLGLNVTDCTCPSSSVLDFLCFLSPSALILTRSLVEKNGPHFLYPTLVGMIGASQVSVSAKRRWFQPSSFVADILKTLLQKFIPSSESSACVKVWEFVKRWVGILSGNAIKAESKSPWGGPEISTEVAQLLLRAASAQSALAKQHRTMISYYKSDWNKKGIRFPPFVRRHLEKKWEMTCRKNRGNEGKNGPLFPTEKAEAASFPLLIGDHLSSVNTTEATKHLLLVALSLAHTIIIISTIPGCKKRDRQKRVTRKSCRTSSL